MSLEKSYYRTLAIAGSDSGGGAGIQADLKTFAALGCYGMSVITALTAQNTNEVQGIYEVSPDFVENQLEAVLSDIGVDAVKIGMLHDPEIIRRVADKLTEYEVEHIVLDPVMVAQSGDKLIKDEAIEALKEQLIPRSTLITPNIPEGEELLDREITDADEVEQAARDLLKMGPEAVLLKGGHFQEERSSDCLACTDPENSNKKIIWYESERIDTPNTHGTGCTLSSAVASGMARGQKLTDAVNMAKGYITGAIKAGSQYRLGRGAGPLHHFYQLWNLNEEKQ